MHCVGSHHQRTYRRTEALEHSINNFAKMVLGGIGETQEVTSNVQEMVMGLKLAAQEKLGRNFTDFSVTHFRTQVVAGMNYFVKVHVGEGNFIHLRIYKDLKREVSLHGVQDGKKETDEIEYF